MIKSTYYTRLDLNSLSSTAATQYMPIPENPPPLNPCPCCGGDAEYRSLHSIWVACKVCGLSTPGCSDIDVLARTWNGTVGIVDTIDDVKYIENVKRDIPENDPVASPKAGQSKP